MQISENFENFGKHGDFFNLSAVKRVENLGSLFVVPCENSPILSEKDTTKDLLFGIPFREEMHVFMNHLLTLNFYSTPDYDLLIELLQRALIRLGYPLNFVLRLIDDDDQETFSNWRAVEIKSKKSEPNLSNGKSPAGGSPLLSFWKFFQLEPNNSTNTLTTTTTTTATTTIPAITTNAIPTRVLTPILSVNTPVSGKLSMGQTHTDSKSKSSLNSSNDTTPVITTATELQMNFVKLENNEKETAQGKENFNENQVAPNNLTWFGNLLKFFNLNPG